MKKALLILLLTAAFVPVSYGQCSGPQLMITFDPGDTSLYSSLRQYIHWQKMITIDTVHYHHNIWQVGKPQKTIFDSAHSDPNVIVTDTIHPYPPNDTSVFILTFQDTSGSGITFNPFMLCLISFYYQLNMDSGSTAKIEFSADTGNTWINLADSTPPGFSTPTPLSTTTGWTYWGINVTYVGYYNWNDSLKFRFTFISSSDTVAYDGWMLDNFNVDYWGIESVPTIQNPHTLSIFPNPATTQLTISSTNEPINEVIISNLLGQVVYRESTTPFPLLKTGGELRIDISSFAPGIYFVKVNGEVHKFVKE